MLSSLRHVRPIAIAIAGALAISACSPGSDVKRGDSDNTLAPRVTLPADVDLPVPLCSEVPDPADSLDFVNTAQFSASANGLLTGSALATALAWPYYVGAWPRDRQGTWIIVGVTGGMVELQTELDRQFPGARVLAMNVQWTEPQLTSIASELEQALADIDGASLVTWSVQTGMVDVRLASITDQHLALLEGFVEKPVCVTVTDV
jgi:hypothetical protein